MDRPSVICHILQSIDGKTAGPFFGVPGVASLAGVYGRLGETFEADAVAYGTTTLDEIFTHGSYLFAGADHLDLTLALEKLTWYYGIKRLLLQGGGLVDGSFANEDLVDELSLVVAPAIDCGSSQPTAFETGDFLGGPITPVAYRLKEVERLEGDGLWMRYERRER